MAEDKLKIMFRMREEFMRLLNQKKPGSYPAWPIDVREKENQQALRETTLRGVEELFEAMAHLKNWKTHRGDGTTHFDHDEFLEELVDALNYFFAVLVLLDIDADDLFKAYLLKHKKIVERLKIV